jgi:hypothetical protein
MNLGQLCWHRLVIRKLRNVCEHCGVEIEECPCVRWRVPDGKCPYCMGSGWVAILRSNREKFEEYLARDRTEAPLLDEW